MSDLSWLNPTPHAIAVYASRPLSPGVTQHSRTLLLTWAGLPPAGSHQLCLAHSFDHLVGAGDQRARNIETERPCGVEVDHEMEPRRLDDRHFRRVGAFKNSTGIATRKAPSVRNGRFIAYEPAVSDEFPSVIDGRDAMLRRKCNKPATALEQKWIGTN